MAVAVWGIAGWGARGGEGEDAGESDAFLKGLVLVSPVMDYAGVLGAERKAALVEAIEAGTASNGAQLVVVSLPSLKGGEIGDFANKLFNHWKLGGKGKDNGVLLLVALEERQAGIEVGYGFEEALPDALCGRIRDGRILPHCREGDYAAALEEGAAALLEEMEDVTFPERKGDKKWMWFFGAVFAGCVALIAWSAMRGGGKAPRRAAGSRRRWGYGTGSHGGARRGGVGGFHGRGGRSGGGGARGGW